MSTAAIILIMHLRAPTEPLLGLIYIYIYSQVFEEDDDEEDETEIIAETWEQKALQLVSFYTFYVGMS